MSKKYYWLKLEKDFFKRHDIRIVESMPNGKDYVLFYLKLILESMNHEGRLRFSETIPYNDDMLATITNTNVDVVRSAVKVFTELGLMEVWDDRTIYLAETNKMVGVETEWAKKKREYRKQQAIETQQGQIETMSDKSKSLELEKELDIEIDKEVDKYDYKSVVDYLNLKTGKNFKNVEGNKKFIRSRYKEGYELEDFKTVIDNMVTEWTGTEWEKYLQPKTLFSNKFDGYLNKDVKKKEMSDIIEYS